MRIAASLSAALAIAGVVACSAPYSGSPERLSKPRPTRQPPDDEIAMVGGGPRQEIARLSTQIQQWRGDAGIPVEPEADAVAAMSHVAAADAARECTAPPPAGTCQDVCELGDSICENATTICDLAEQLPGDAWAEGKCDSAKASCREADERCCTCRAGGRP